MGVSTVNNSAEIAKEQSVETQDGQTGEQPGGGESPKNVTNISLEDVNRDDLAPEMQVVYDGLLEKGSAMQADYTRKTTELAGLRRDAEYWRTIQQHPELAEHINRAVYNVSQGMPLGTSVEQQAPAEKPAPDAEQDPEGYLKSIISQEVRAALGDVMPEIQKGIQNVTGYVASSQSRLEFDNIAAKYLAAKAIGLEEIQRVQQAYQHNGRPISMEEALSLMALDNPDILRTGQASSQTTRGKETVVERPSSGAASEGSSEIVVPEGVTRLLKEARQLDTDGDTTLAGAARRALDKIRNLKTTR